MQVSGWNEIADSLPVGALDISDALGDMKPIVSDLTVAKT